MIVRVKGVKKVRAKGHTYYYHRKTMTPLPGEPGSAEFMAALDALNRKQEASGPGTLGALIRLYRASPDFTDLAANTKRNRQWVFDYLKPLDGMPLIGITSGLIYQIRDKAKAKHKRSFANLLIDVLRYVFDWAIKRE